MKKVIFKNHNRNILIYLVLVLTASISLLGCNLVGVNQKEAKEEIGIFGPIEEYNPKIKDIQKFLSDSEFYSGIVDGRMGWQTRKAIREFQKINSLKITGFIDTQTYERLNSYMGFITGETMASNETMVSNASKPVEEIKKEVSQQQSLPQEIKEIGREEIKTQLNSPEGVKKIQQALKNAGFDPGSIDGKMGKKTKKAVAAFQESKKLTADGVIGVKTWKALSEYFVKE